MQCENAEGVWIHDYVVDQDEILTFNNIKESITGAAFDFTYHINENFKFYSEAAMLIGSKDYYLPNEDALQWQPGLGLIPFGLKGLPVPENNGASTIAVPFLINLYGDLPSFLCSVKKVS